MSGGFFPQCIGWAFIIFFFEVGLCDFLSSFLPPKLVKRSKCVTGNYAWMYFMFLLSLASTLLNMYTDVLLETDWLNPQKVSSFVIDKYGDSKDYDKWREEADLTDYPVLRFFSFSSAVWVSGTYLVCQLNVGLHWRAIRLRRCSESLLRNGTIFIIGLPVAYGLVSLRVVYRCWEMYMARIMGSNFDFFHSFDRGQAFFAHMKEVNLKVGDVYEAYSLVVFGQIVFRVIKRKQTTPGEHDTTIRALALKGVIYFCVVVLLQTVWMAVSAIAYANCAIQKFRISNKELGTCNFQSVEGKIQGMFIGAGTLASFIAVSNVMKVEHDFHDELDDFHPKLKFLSTKILLSVAFGQEVALLIILASWSDTRRDLLEASLLCFECFLLSILHFATWRPLQPWYDAATVYGSELEMQTRRTTI